MGQALLPAKTAPGRQAGLIMSQRDRLGVAVGRGVGNVVLHVRRASGTKLGQRASRIGVREIGPRDAVGKFRQPDDQVIEKDIQVTADAPRIGLRERLHVTQAQRSLQGQHNSRLLVHERISLLAG